MSVWALLSFVSFIVCLILSNYVYYLDRKNPLNKNFTLFCVLVALWAFAEFMCRQVGTEEQARFWVKFLSFWPLITSVLFFFVARFTGRGRIYSNKILRFMIFSITFILVAVEIFLNEPEKVPWGYTFKYIQGSFYSVFGTIEEVFILALTAAIFFLLVKFIRESKDQKKCQQAKYFLIAFFIPFLSGIFQLVTSNLIEERTPEFTAFTFSWFVGMVTYAIRKSGLLSIDPYMAAENILFTMADSLVLLDSEKNVISANRAFLDISGYKNSDVEGKSVNGFLSGAAKNGDLFRGSILRNGEGAFLAADGKEIPVFFNVNSISDNKGAILGYVMAARDLREIKKYQEKLVQSEKLAAVGLLAGGVAHEINNPMTVILGFTQLLLKNTDRDEKTLKTLKAIETHALRCRNLITDLLVFSRSSNQLPVRLNFNKAVENSLGLVAAQQKVKNISLESVFDDKVKNIMGSESQIQQVVINLCSNAIDAMPDGGKLRIETVLENSEAVLRVSDTGTGIPAEVQKRIFEPFMTTKEVGKGTGLGLSICYEIVRKLNGSISFASEAEKGTTFIVRFPQVG